MWVDNLIVSTSRLIPNAVEENRNVDLTISPNPASEYIEIKLSESYQIKIYNTYGQCVLSVGAHCNVPLQRIDVSGLPVWGCML